MSGFKRKANRREIPFLFLMVYTTAVTETVAVKGYF